MQTETRKTIRTTTRKKSSKGNRNEAYWKRAAGPRRAELAEYQWKTPVKEEERYSVRPFRVIRVINSSKSIREQWEEVNGDEEA